MLNGTTDTKVPVTVGIVADDLTGANDSAVQFASRGWHTSLALVHGPVSAPQRGCVIALVSDARAQQGDAARASTADAVARLCESGVDRMFLKIDSTMRGSVNDQITGALDAWAIRQPNAFAVVCPAYPEMGRTIAGGRLLVDGVGVETTAIGRDPVTPVSNSQLSVLLPDSTGIAAGDGGSAGLATRIGAAAASGCRVVVVDAATTEELDEIADAIATFGPRCVPVGAGGLAVAMSAIWGCAALHGVLGIRPRKPATRVLVVETSLHDMSRSQFERLSASLPASCVRVLVPSVEAALDTESIADWIARKIESDPHLPQLVLVRSPDARPAPGSEGLDRKSAAMAITSSLAIITEGVFNHAQVDAFVLVGGEGARAVLDRLDAQSIRVTEAIREGIPIGSIDGGKAHGLTVVTKAGGFGTSESLAEIVSELLNNV